MVFFLKDVRSKTWRPWDDYVALSFFISTVLFFTQWLNHSDSFIEDLFFPALLFISHYQFFKEIKARAFVFVTHFPLFFLLQAFSLMGMGFVTGRPGLLFLTLIPCLAAGHFFAIYEDEKKNRVGKGMLLLFLMLLSGVSFFSFGKKMVLNYFDFIDLGCFIFWVFGMGYGIIEAYRKFEKRPLSMRHPRTSNYERLFFHDLINHTHGLNLFLNFKIAKNAGLSFDETKNVFSEVRLMQSLLKDHYGYGHKNLANTYDCVHFEFAKKGIYNLIRNFLPEREVKCEFSFTGFLAHDCLEDRPCLVHYPTFHRILTNLVKNISETRSSKVRFVFSYDEEGLHLEVRNRFMMLQNEKDSLEKKLANLILEGDQKSEDEGFGIESIHTLCEKEGGRFQFGLEGQEWVSKVFLPSPQISKINSGPIAA